MEYLGTKTSDNSPATKGDLASLLNNSTLTGTAYINGAYKSKIVSPTASSSTFTIDCSAGNYFSFEVDDGGPIFVGSSSASAGATSSMVLNMPSGLQQNDYVLVMVGCDGNSPNVPSGWTYFENSALTSGTAYAVMFYKQMGSTPDTSVTITGLNTGSAAIAYAFRRAGVNSNGNLSSTIGSTGMPNPQQASSLTVGSDMVAIFGWVDDDNIVPTAPAGYGDFVYQQSGAASTGTAMAALKRVVSATSDDPAAFGGSGTDEWTAHTVRIDGYRTAQSVAFSNVPSNCVFSVLLEISFLGATAINWPNSVKWPYGVAPTFVDTQKNLVALVTDDGGTTWRGNAITGYVS